MAQKTIVTLEDDLDGGPADQTVSFALDGTSYEIDLSESNAQAMREALAKYVGAGHKAQRNNENRAKRAVAERRTAKPNAKGYTPADVREWAKGEGIEVSDRGRFSAEVIEKYEYAKGLDKK